MKIDINLSVPTSFVTTRMPLDAGLKLLCGTEQPLFIGTETIPVLIACDVQFASVKPIVFVNDEVIGCDYVGYYHGRVYYSGSSGPIALSESEMRDMVWRITSCRCTVNYEGSP